MKLFLFLIFLFALLLSISGMNPPSVAQNFSAEFDLMVHVEPIILREVYMFSGNLSISYPLAAGDLNFTSCTQDGIKYNPACNYTDVEWWEGLISPSASNTFQSSAYIINNNNCTYFGSFNKSYVNQYFRFDIPSHAEYLGTANIRGYSCSGWKYQRYGIEYGISYTYDIFENVTEWVDQTTGAIVNLTVSESSSQNGSSPYLVFSYKANNIVVGPISKSSYSPPDSCHSFMPDPKARVNHKDDSFPSENFNIQSLFKFFFRG